MFTATSDCRHSDVSSSMSVRYGNGKRSRRRQEVSSPSEWLRGFTPCNGLQRHFHNMRRPARHHQSMSESFEREGRGRSRRPKHLNTETAENVTADAQQLDPSKLGSEISDNVGRILYHKEPDLSPTERLEATFDERARVDNETVNSAEREGKKAELMQWHVQTSCRPSAQNPEVLSSENAEAKRRPSYEIARRRNNGERIGLNRKRKRSPRETGLIPGERERWEQRDKEWANEERWVLRLACQSLIEKVKEDAERDARQNVVSKIARMMLGKNRKLSRLAER